MKTFLSTKKNKQAKKKLEQSIVIKHFIQRAGNDSNELKVDINKMLLKFEKMLQAPHGA